VLRAPPCLILLDLRLPAMDGSAVVVAQRQLPGPAAAIVVLSAEPDGQWEARELGAAGYLRKPFDLDDLLITVARQVAALPVA